MTATAMPPSKAAGRRRWRAMAQGDFASAFSDVFEDLFGDFMGGRGGGGARSRAQRGSDLRYNLRVSLEEAYLGVQKTINVPASVTCDVCRGTGAEGGAEPVTCPTCSGMGKVRAQQGFFTVERTCPTCGGMGQIVKNPCRTCGGAGRIEKERALSVNIPAGVETGTRIRLAGEGEAGLRGGPTGDLYIFIEVKEHPIFQPRRRAPLLPRAGQHRHRRAGRRGRGADHRRRQEPGEGARRQPDRQADAPARQGHARAARRRQGDMLIEMAVETPGQPDLAPEGASARVREAERGQQPRRLDLLFQGQDLLGRDEGLRSRLRRGRGGRLPLRTSRRDL